jgi:hypothetical protein
LDVPLNNRGQITWIGSNDLNLCEVSGTPPYCRWHAASNNQGTNMTNQTLSNFNRRSFLAAAASTTVAWPFLNMRQVEAADRRVRTADYPFQLGVASGDPAPDGVVIWTRLAPDPINGGGMPPEDVRVRWQVATDEATCQRR